MNKKYTLRCVLALGTLGGLTGLYSSIYAHGGGGGGGHGGGGGGGHAGGGRSFGGGGRGGGARAAHAGGRGGASHAHGYNHGGNRGRGGRGWNHGNWGRWGWGGGGFWAASAFLWTGWPFFWGFGLWPWIYLAGRPYYYVEPRDYSNQLYWKFINNSNEKIIITINGTQIFLPENKSTWARKTPGRTFSIASESHGQEEQFSSDASRINIEQDDDGQLVIQP